MKPLPMKSRRRKLQPTGRVLIQPCTDFSLSFTALCDPMPQHLRRGRNFKTGKVIAYADDPTGRYTKMVQLLEMRAREAACGLTVLGPIALEVVWIFGVDEIPARALEAAALPPGYRGDCPHNDTPDTDNLLKPLKDAVTRSKLWADDKQVSHENLMKRWSTEHQSQIRVYITRDTCGVGS